ncbi:MAG: glycogen synthase GlgA [Clostridium sp.]
MNVLFVAGECDPFIKTGGLGDVVGALPQYLRKHEVEVSVVIPKYGDISEEIVSKMKMVKEFNVQMSWRSQYCGVLQYQKGGITYYFVDNEFYFKRKGAYGYGDDGERFAFFDRAVMMMLKEIDFKPDIIHCHDWQTGMIPVLLKYDYFGDEFYKDIATVYTIHNLKFQGVFSKDKLGDWFNLSEELYDNDTVRFYDCMNFMKGAIKASDKITTVSKTYSEEIKNDFYGEQLQGLLREREQDLLGIENGIDYKVYDPGKDPYIEKKYSKFRLNNKKADKIALQRELGLEENEDIPMMAMVSRLTSQKGLDILTDALNEIIQGEVQVVVLGTGEWDYEQYFLNLSERFPHKAAAVIAFDNALAHKIYAGADMFLMPSLFEPCGLGQLIALRYGTIPIVRETGGLRDTVHFYEASSNEGNGFTFYDYTTYELRKTIKIALDYYKDKELWKQIVINAMESENSWDKSAVEYINLYKELI